MKKLLFAVGVGAILLSACSGNEKKINEDSLRIADLTEEYQEATNFNDSLMLLMGDIYTGLDSINQQEGLLYNMGSGDNVDRRAEIRQNLSNIKSRLNANRKLLSELQAKANKAGQLTKTQQRTIETLNARIAAQEEKIAQLNADLESAKGQIRDLNDQVAQGKEQLTQANAATAEAQEQTKAVENEANKVYYCLGTNKELKENGMISKKFLGATKVMAGDVNNSYFTRADKRTLTSIPTGAKKVKIWSQQPADSYEIVGEKDGPKTIKITNPSKFWQYSNVLIIQQD